MAGRWGFVVIFNRIPELIAAVEANSASATKRGATRVRDGAKARAPIDTGYLHDSIEAHGDGKEWFVTVGAEYGVFVEFGTYKMAAQPFFLPAVQAAGAEFFHEVGAGVSFG
jgi:HK97 gp10 family phage protein